MSSAAAQDKSTHGEVTIIRIKRKRSEDVPEDMLSTHQTDSSKRNDHSRNSARPLVVDNNDPIDSEDGKGTKRRRPAKSVFQFAETIDEEEWKRIKQDELRVRPASRAISRNCGPFETNSIVPQSRISALSKSPSKPTDAWPKKDSKDTAASPSPIPTKRQRSVTQSDTSTRKYRVIAHGSHTEKRPSRFYPSPYVISQSAIPVSTIDVMSDD